MDRAYSSLVGELIEQGDFASAKAALQRKMDEGDGKAYALFGAYVFMQTFEEYQPDDAFAFWDKGALLGDVDCVGLRYLKKATIYEDGEGTIVLKVDKTAMGVLLENAAKGHGVLYEFLFLWIVEDCLHLEIDDQSRYRLIIECARYYAQSNPYYLELKFLAVLYHCQRTEHTSEEFEELLDTCRDLLSEEHPFLTLCLAAEVMCTYPELVDRKELMRWITCTKKDLPAHYQYLLALYKERDLHMSEIVLHAEECYRLEKSNCFNTCVYAYCLLKGKGVDKDLREVERLLAPHDSDFALIMKAHCRMFVDPEYPDIKAAIELLDQAEETKAVYMDKMLYLLYAESKNALSASLAKRLREELAESKAYEEEVYLFLRGVRLALKPEDNAKEVINCFMDEKTIYHDAICLWMQGCVTHYALDALAGIILDDTIDTDMRYQAAFRLVIERSLLKNKKDIEEAYQWVDALGGEKYAARNQTLRYLMSFLKEQDYRKRQPIIKKFLSAYESLKEDGLSSYLRVCIEATNPHIHKGRLKHFVDLTEASQDGYSMVCVAHILEKLPFKDLFMRGVYLENKGSELSPFNRMDLIIESVTGGSFGDVFD